MTPIKSSCIVCSSKFTVEKEFVPFLYDDFGVFCQFFCPQNVKTAVNEDRALWISFSFCSTCKTTLDDLCNFQDQLTSLQKEIARIRSQLARKISNERGKVSTIVAARIETVRQDICKHYKPHVVLSDCSNDLTNSSKPSSPLLQLKQDDSDLLDETKDELESPPLSDEECNENLELDNVPFQDDTIESYHDAGYHEENDDPINISSNKFPLKSIAAPPVTKINGKGRRQERVSKTTSIEGNLEKVSRKNSVSKKLGIVQDSGPDTLLLSQPRKRRAAAAAFINRVAANKSQSKSKAVITKKLKFDPVQYASSEEDSSSFGDEKDDDFILEKAKSGRRRGPPKRTYSKLKSEPSSKSLQPQYKCNHCPRTFQSLLARNGHVKKSHQGDSKPYECHDCNRKFEKPSKLLGHQKRWHSIQPKSESSNNKDKKPSSAAAFACPECCMMFKSEQTRDAHILRFHKGEKRPYKCGVCDKCYRHKVHLDDHMELHAASGTRFPCKECNKEFLSERKLRVHLAKVHFPGERPFKCDNCTRSFAKVYLLESHMYKHTGQKRYICEICGHSYTSNKRLQVHLQRHASGVEIKEPFQCEQCDKVFSEPQSLSSHVMSIHEKKFRFHCEVCGQGCQMLSMLKRHMLCHTQDKMFACEICENKKFKRKPQLVQHMLIHEGKFPYVCRHCGKGFRASEKLKNHEKLHTGEKPFACSEPGCTKTFALKHYLTNHINTSHKGMKQQKRPKTRDGPPRKGHSTQRVKPIPKPSSTVTDIVVVNRNCQDTEIIPVEVYQQATQPIHPADLAQSQQQQQSLLVSTTTEAEAEAIAASVSNVITISQTGDQQIVTTYPEDQSYEWLQFGFIAANPTETTVRIEECEQTGPATVVVSTPSGYKVEGDFSTS